MACLAWAYIKEGKNDKAQNLLITASKISAPESKEYYDIQYLTALALNKAGRYSESENIFKNLLDVYPNEPFYLASFGILEENMLKYPYAISFLWKAVAFLPERHDILYNIGQIYEKVGCINEAFFLYTKIIELFPDHQQAKNRINECHLNEKFIINPIELLTLDISEFPFHKKLEKAGRPKNLVIDIPTPDLPNEIATPSPVYPNFIDNQLSSNMFQSNSLILPQKRQNSINIMDLKEE